MQRTWIPAACSALVVAVVAILVIMAMTTDSSPEAVPETPRTLEIGSPQNAPGVPSFDDARAEIIAQDLASADEVRIQNAIAMPEGVAVSPEVIAGLADLTPITFDMSTLRYIDTTSAAVTADTGPDRRPWLIYLIFDGTTWQIAATEPGSSR